MHELQATSIQSITPTKFYSDPVHIRSNRGLGDLASVTHWPVFLLGLKSSCLLKAPTPLPASLVSAHEWRYSMMWTGQEKEVLENSDF